MSEKYPVDNSLIVDIDGVLHFESEQDGVVAYRPCPPELISLVLANQPSSTVEEKDIPTKTIQERRHISPKLIRGAAKVALFGAVLGGAHIGANFAITQILSGNTRGDFTKTTEDLWTDVTLPLRMVEGK
jgi:hypothetical protein